MRRPRGEHVAVAAGLLLAAVAAVVLVTRDDDEQPPATTQAAPPPPPPSPPRALTVIGSGRRIQPDGDTSSEPFPSLGARIYQTVG